LLGLLYSLLVDVAPAATYACLAAGGAFLLFWDHGLVFTGTETFQKVASLIISTSVVAWLLIVVLSLPLAVSRRGLRCIPLSDREAAEIGRFIAQIVTLGAVSWIIVVSLYLSWVGDGLPRLVLVVVGLVICATSLRALGRIRSRFSGFTKMYHKPAGFGVIGLTMIWCIALLSRQLPPFWPVLLSVMILAGLPAADGMATLLLERLQRRLVQSGQASRRIFTPMIRRGRANRIRKAARRSGATSDPHGDGAVRQRSDRGRHAGGALGHYDRGCAAARRNLVLRSLSDASAMGADGARQYRRSRRHVTRRLVRLAFLRNGPHGQTESWGRWPAKPREPCSRCFAPWAS
jgi:hypothetical protein